jgi:hypothetical protein
MLLPESGGLPSLFSAFTATLSRTSPPARVSMSRRTLQRCLLSAFVILAVADAKAEGCPTAKDEIATDRPDVTNSSLVVPVGSFQSENGLNFRGQDGGQIIDGTNTRWRLGIAPCLEVLMDLPTDFATVRGPGSSGFTDVTPAIKWQVSPIPGKIDLSLVAGVALPTGAVNIAGPGAQPYLQMPWSWEPERVNDSETVLFGI